MTDTQLLALAEKIRLRLGAGKDVSLHRAIDAASKTGRINPAETRQLRFIATFAPRAARGEAPLRTLSDAVYAASAWLAYDDTRSRQAAEGPTATPADAGSICLPVVTPAGETVTAKSKFSAAVAVVCLVIGLTMILALGALK